MSVWPSRGTKLTKEKLVYHYYFHAWQFQKEYVTVHAGVKRENKAASVRKELQSIPIN